jgi:RimJ/RimL family protein N-acetyltransferase
MIAAHGTDPDSSTGVLSPEAAKSIVTERLVLVPLTDEHMSHIERLYGDAEIVRGWNRDAYTPEQISDHATERLLGSWRSYGFCQYLICEHSDHVVVGIAGLRPHAGEATGEIGYLFVPEIWGRGYGTEAVDALVEWGFSQLGLARIVADGVSNPSSKALLVKTGFSLYAAETVDGVEFASYEVVNDEIRGDQRQ